MRQYQGVPERPWHSEMHQRSFSMQPYRVSSCRLISTPRHTPVKCCAGVGNKNGFLRRHVLPLFRASVEPRISVIRAYRCLPPSTRYTKLCSIQSLNSGRSALVSRQLSVATVISTQELVRNKWLDWSFFIPRYLRTKVVYEGSS